MHMEEDAGKLIHDEWEDCSLWTTTEAVFLWLRSYPNRT